MLRIKGNNTAYFDVDDTIIKHYSSFEELESKGVFLEYSKLTVVPHKRHIEDLKNMKKKGFTVIVWSQGGEEHACDVVKTLGLEDFVDATMTKPSVYWDDLKANEFMDYRVWREDE